MKKNKKLIIGLGIICFILLAAALTFLIMYLVKPKYEVKVNTGGGKIIKDVVIKDNVVKSLPEITPPKEKKLVAWINKKKEVVRPEIELNGDDEWNPVFGPETGEYVTIKFETGTSEKIEPLKIPKGTGLYLPVPPKNYKNWKFLYWVDKDEYIAIQGKAVNEDMTLYAYWWKPGTGGTKKETVTISYDTGTKEKFDDINLIKGSKIIFYEPTEKNGDKVFKGWLDESGNLISKDAVAKKDMKLKAKWVDPYTCPEGCTPAQDGKTCTKENLVEPSKETICPGEMFNGYCVDTKNVNPELDCERQCSDGEPFGNTEVTMPIVREGLASVCCVKKIDRVEKFTCPEGYDRDGDKCKKVETLECQAN